MLVESLAGSGVRTVFEGTLPKGIKKAYFEGTGSELFRHVLGCIRPSVVLQAHKVFRDTNRCFLSVEDVIDGGNAVS